ncbi:MAG: hypothetical protein Q9161_005139 [Pseudevernia consocians]
MSRTLETVKVAAVQAAPVAFDLPKSLEKVAHFAAEAAKAGADLLVPTGAERLIWGRGSGDGLVVADTEIGKVGGLICWENYMPAARLALYQKGIEIYIAPNADDLPSWIATMQHIAKEGRCFVINSNQFCKVSDFPSDYPPFAASDPSDHKPDGTAWTADDVLSHGGSCIIGPLGTFLAEPVWDKEGIVYAELRMGELTEAKMDQLNVNTSPGTSVTFDG